MADRLAIYRGALRLLGPSNLASLSEDRPEKLALDAAWDDAVNFMLEQGLWHFAIRAAQLQPDEDVEPLFGFDYAYSKPEDWVRTVSICYDPSYRESIREFEDETQYWHTSYSAIYVRYISNDEAYGWNIGAWRQHFAKALEAYLAFECGLPISSDKGNRNDLHSLFKSRLQDAKTKDAVDERVREKPPGCWTRSRIQGHSGDRRRG